MFELKDKIENVAENIEEIAQSYYRLSVIQLVQKGSKTGRSVTGDWPGDLACLFQFSVYRFWGQLVDRKCIGASYVGVFDRCRVFAISARSYFSP